MLPSTPTPPSILHICHREMLRPLRDQILRLSGFDVDSTLSYEDGLSRFWSKHYDLPRVTPFAICVVDETTVIA